MPGTHTNYNGSTAHDCNYRNAQSRKKHYSERVAYGRYWPRTLGEAQHRNTARPIYETQLRFETELMR